MSESWGWGGVGGRGMEDLCKNGIKKKGGERKRESKKKKKRRKKKTTTKN